MRRRMLTIATMLWFTTVLCFFPYSALGGELRRLTDVELDQIHAGNSDNEWVDFQVGAMEGVTPFFMGDVNITDSAMENLRAMVNVVAAGSVINISLNVAVIKVSNTGTADIDVQFFSDVTNSLNFTNFGAGM